jgi:hypothetical protein
MVGAADLPPALAGAAVGGCRTYLQVGANFTLEPLMP